MSRQAAKGFYARRSGEPETGYITPEDAQAALDVVYNDMETGDQMNRSTPRLVWKGGNVSAWNTPTDPAAVPSGRSGIAVPTGSGLSAITADVNRLGLNVVTVPVRIAASSITDSAPALDADHLEWARSIVDALPSGVQVIAEPYPWVASGNQSETLWNPADKQAWFHSWGSACVQVALAMPRAAMVYVGSNLVAMEGGYEAEWATLVQRVRDAGARSVSYRANWWYERARLDALKGWQLLSKVDVISVAAYFELTDTPSPQYDEVRACLDGTLIHERNQNLIGQCAELSAAHGNRPIFFGELNCGNGALSLSAPWNPDVSTVRDRMVQARLFRAYTEGFAPQPWFRGFSVFNIGHPFGDSRYLLDPPAVRYLQSIPTTGLIA